MKIKSIIIYLIASSLSCSKDNTSPSSAVLLDNKGQASSITNINGRVVIRSNLLLKNVEIVTVDDNNKPIPNMSINYGEYSDKFSIVIYDSKGIYAPALIFGNPTLLKINTIVSNGDNVIESKLVSTGDILTVISTFKKGVDIASGIREMSGFYMTDVADVGTDSRGGYTLYCKKPAEIINYIKDRYKYDSAFITLPLGIVISAFSGPAAPAISIKLFAIRNAISDAIGAFVSWYIKYTGINVDHNTNFVIKVYDWGSIIPGAELVGGVSSYIDNNLCPQPCVVTTEICDGKDNDCDGIIDEDLGSTTCGYGVCKVNVAKCVNGSTVTCTPDNSKASNEICDGIDNDCDNLVDEGNVCQQTSCTIQISSDTSWKATDTFYTEWETSIYDDSSWGYAADWAGKYSGSITPQNIPGWNGTNAKFIWVSSDPLIAYFRKKVNVNCIFTSASIKIWADDEHYLYVNGTFVGSGTANSSGGTKNYNALSLLQQGTNVIAIRGRELGAGSHSVLFEMLIQ